MKAARELAPMSAETPEPTGATLKLSPEARAWADSTLVDLESSLGEPDEALWESMRADGLERRDYIAAWKMTGRLLRIHRELVRDRMGDEIEGSEADALAARWRLSTHRWSRAGGTPKTREPSVTAPSRKPGMTPTMTTAFPRGIRIRPDERPSH
jgi:hypothetical protein